MVDRPVLDERTTTGQRIRAYRDWRGLSRSEVAERLGRSDSWLYQIERGIESRDQRLGWALLRDLAELLDVTVEDLLGPTATRSTGRGVGPGNAVLAVVPIRWSSPGSGGTRLDEFLASGFCDDLVTRLTKLTSLLVVGPDSTRPLVEAGRTLLGIGEELSAQVVLAGTMQQRAADRLHLNLRLVELATSVTLWSEAYDVPYSELGSVQAQAVASIARTLRLEPGSAERQPRTAPSTDAVNAFEFYLRGVGLLATNHERDVVVGLAMLDRAIQLDPSFADAHAYRGYALWRRYFSGWDADVTLLRQALDSADRALNLDPASAVGRLARIRVYWDLGRHEDALAEGVAVVRQNPQSQDALLALARAYNNGGMAEQALPLTERVLSIDPGNRVARKLLVWNHLMVRDHMRAAHIGDAYLRANPDDANTAWAVAAAHLHLGELDAARAIVERGLRADRHDFTLWLMLGYVHRARRDTSAMEAAWQDGAEIVASRLAIVGANYRVHAWLACLYAAAGSRGDAAATIRRVREAEPENGYLLYRIGCAHAELGEHDQAVAALESAVRNGFLSLQMWRIEEVCGLGSVLDHPGYRRAMAELDRRVTALRRKYAPPVVTG